MLKLRLLSIDFESTTLDSLEESLHTLPSALQDKVNSFHNPQDKLMSLCTRLLIRQAIAEDLSTPLGSISLSYGEYGKPYVPNHVGYHFSVSHCDNMVVYVSHNKPIGIDIESIKERNPKIERRLYTPNEVAYVESGSNPDVNYFEVWTMKESYSKLLGLGLNLPFSSFDTTVLSAKGYYYTKTINNYVVTICTEDALKLHVETINLSI